MITLQRYKLVHVQMAAVRVWPCAVAIAVAFVSAFSHAATSVSQHGITWTFSADRPVGQYANGDWWVVGPVSITRISPDSTTDATGWTKNGTMVNPPVGSGQGFDSSIQYTGAWWAPSLNVAPGFTRTPLVAAAGSSVVSVISKPVAGSSGVRPQLTDGAVLTVVGSAPAAGAFRPPIMGSDKTHYWNKSGLRYDILQRLAPVASTPPLATVEGYFARPWFAQMEESPARYIAPYNNMPEYGRDQAQRLSLGLLSLHLNYTDAQKEKLYIYLVQYGIDIYGSVKAGTVFRDMGGLNAGRKAPLVLAGLALNDANILKWADGGKSFVFQEDRSTWYVSQSDVGRVMYQGDGRPRETYLQSHVGMPEWGEQHTKQPNRDASNWGTAYYRWVGGAWLGNVLMARLIPGGVQAWNHQALFDYSDRYWELENKAQTFSAPNNISPFVYEMWAAYRGTPPVTSPPPVVTLAVGDRIETLGNTNVRTTGSLSGTLLGSQAQGALGTIVGGPTVADSVTWWQVDYDNGVDGWSGGDNLIKSTAPPPAVTFAIGDRIETLNKTNVRATGSLTGTLLGTQAIGALGTIISGPVPADNITWWEVNYDTGTDGWSGGDNFVKSTTPPVPPSPPQGLKVIK